jgi:cytochrome c oxidase subunit 2
MNKLRMGLMALMLAGALLVTAQDTGSGSAGIKMTAKKYEFTPGTIRVKKGERVRLLITALDRAHGFKIEAFKLEQKLPKGEEVTIEFTADQSGTFPFQCSEVCGLGHKKMKGELIVE